MKLRRSPSSRELRLNFSFFSDFVFTTNRHLSRFKKGLAIVAEHSAVDFEKLTHTVQAETFS